MISDMPKVAPLPHASTQAEALFCSPRPPANIRGIPDFPTAEPIVIRRDSLLVRHRFVGKQISRRKRGINAPERTNRIAHGPVGIVNRRPSTFRRQVLTNQFSLVAQFAGRSPS